MAKEQQPNGVHFVVVTGLSGSGKSSVLKAMEDIGYYAVDNLPPQLLPAFVNLPVNSLDDSFKAVMGMDIRGHRFPEVFPAIYKDLAARGFNLELVFLDATDEVLTRRFSETRRVHPLADGQETSLASGISKERVLMEPIKAMATQVLDTSNLTIHQLRKAISSMFSGDHASSGMRINVMSFGFKKGIPPEADLVFDVRFLPNPHFVEELRPQTGLDKPVSDYVLKEDVTKQFQKHLLSILKFLIPQYQAEGKSRLTIAIGCTGGRHRSVALAKWLSSELESEELPTYVRHRDLD